VRSRAPLVAVVLTLLLAAVVVLVWGRSMFSSVEAVSQSELEDEVAGLYSSSNPGDDLVASCAGELASEVDATQDCKVQVGGDVARVHVVVASVDGNDVRFEATPYLPAAVVADSMKKSIADDGDPVDTVACDGELRGVQDSSTTCTVTPPAAGQPYRAWVTSVDGLVINFSYKKARDE
jgi:hypothetical protein